MGARELSLHSRIPFPRLKRFATHRGYPLLVAFLVFLDAFVFFIPNEALIISAVLLRPDRWLSTSLESTVSSAAGAAVFGFLASAYGDSFVNYLFPSILKSGAWLRSAEILQHHGIWGLALISFSPLPQHAAVGVAGLAHLSALQIFLAVLLGRGVKYVATGWCAVHAPHILRKLRILR
jgi:membrane protein YqaA with SNARE-associated domain